MTRTKTVFYFVPLLHMRSRFVPVLFLSFALAIVVLSSSCKKEPQGVPYTYVNATIYTSDPQYVQLQSIGGWLYLTGGYRGLLVYRKSQTEFMAYDRACPYKPEDSNELLKVDTSNIIVTDSHCGSKFLITDGSTLQGPSSLPMKAYATSFDGATLRIAN